VDDIKTNLVVASGLLSPYRMQIDLCDGGAEAVETVKSNKYDIVFMDHRMPDVDGVEAVKRIRKMGIDDPSFSELPIIALTANAVSGVREMFLENGFDDFMPKPIDTVKLNSILEQWIPKHKQKILTDDNASAANAYIDTLNIDGLNYAMGVRLSGGEEKAYYNTLGVFYDDGLERIEKIANCLESGDLDLYTTLVHALKSALANIGADELSESAFELEMAGQLDDLPFIEERNDTFLSALKRLIDDIGSALSLHGGASDPEADLSALTHLRFGFEYLKTAINNMDIGEIDLSIDSLKKSALSDEENALLKIISKHILMGEYDETLLLIDKLLE